MILSWKLQLSSLRGYANRYALKLNCEKEDAYMLHNFLIKEFNLEVSPVFQISEEDYKWCFYLYNVFKKNELVNYLFSLCKNGLLVEEDETQQLLEKQNDLNEILRDSSQKFSDSFLKEEKISQEYKVFSFIPLNPKYTFENFIVGTNNRFTHAAALAVAENPGKTYNPLFIYGGVGLGKTHLMQAIGHYVIEKHHKKVIYITAEKFVTHVIDAIRLGAIQRLRELYSNVDVLLLDDVQFLTESESTQEEFFHIFNSLYQLGKQIVLTSDKPPKLLTTLEDRLRSRFEWGLIADIKSPSLETRVAILKKKGEEENINLDDNILLYIASKLKSNVRELEGFLKRITAYASITKQQIDIKLVKELMCELLPEEELTEEEKKILKKKQEEFQEKQIEFVEPKKQQVKRQLVIQTYPLVEQNFVAKVELVSKQKDAVFTTREATIQEEVPSDEQLYKDYTAAINKIEAVFFYPEGEQQQVFTVKQKFADVIKKHNLKYKIISVLEKEYVPTEQNYHIFVKTCKENNVNVCIMLSPPPESEVSSEELYNNIVPIMEANDIIFEYLPWKELNKEYKYLNLALDIALSKFKIV